jgi:hypothetical protein
MGLNAKCKLRSFESRCLDIATMEPPMTIVVSVGLPSFVVMANDSAILREFENGRREYVTGKKWWAKPGIGVVTMWGARDGNTLISHLEKRSLERGTHFVDDLAEAVLNYLVTDFSPAKHAIGDTGYHIGGFDRDGHARLFHAFWNTEGSPGAFESLGAYSLQDQSPTTNVARFIYNGRNDLADKVISGLIAELRRGAPVRFGRTPPEIARLCHFILRFAAELTPEVGPPFCIHLLSPNGEIARECLDTESPLRIGHFEDAWKTASGAA